MIQGACCSPYTIRQATVYSLPVPDSEVQFPVLQIDVDSYIVGAEIQSGIDFNYAEGVHCIQIGKYSALAEKITFLVNLNHDYKSVFQGSPVFLSEGKVSKLKKKGSVLIQNDVWIGHGATLISGITIHNGAIVGAESVITKDVPPYAIAAGNPAKIIGYRFPEEQRIALNAIAWWNWSQDRLMERKEAFLKPVEYFIEAYQKEADEVWNQAVPAFEKDDRKNILFIMDVEEPYPVWQKVIKEYFSSWGIWPETRLILYLLPSSVEKGYKNVIMEFIKDYKDQDAKILLQEGTAEEEIRSLFAAADYFITTRQVKNLLWTEYADHYGVKLQYGTDIPVFSL